MSELLGVHGHWLSRTDRTDSVAGFRGSLRERLVTRAAGQLYAHEGPMFVSRNGAKIKGFDSPSTTEVFEKQIDYVPPQEMLLENTGFGTLQEALVFQEQARRFGVEKVITLAFPEHRPSIDRFTPEKTKEDRDYLVEHRFVPDVLRQYDDPRIARIAERLSSRRNMYHWGFVFYELVKTVLVSLPGGKDRLYQGTETPQVGQLKDRITHLIDVFKS